VATRSGALSEGEVVEHLLALLRLSAQRLELVDFLEQALAILSGWTGLGLKPGGCVYLLDKPGGWLRAVVRSGLADHLMLSPRELPDDPALWGACDEAVADRFVRWDSFPAAARRDGWLPRPLVFPIATEERRLGLLVLFADPAAESLAAKQGLAGGIVNLLAGMIARLCAEESLRASQERFDLAVRGTDAGIWDWDLRTNRVYYSPRWKGMLGYADWEIGEEFAEWESRLHPEDRARAKARIRDYLEGRRPDYELEHRLRHRDGTYRWILARGAAVYDTRGNPVRMVGSHLDITERRRVEQRLSEQAAGMQAARRIQQRLLPQRPPLVAGIEVAGASRPAEETGGDFFDFFALEGGRLGLCVADVSGHGYESALLMATTAARIRSYLEFPLGLQELVERTNRALERETDGERFVTMTLVWVDPVAGELRFVNAGNPAGLVLSVDGELRARLVSEAPPLAVWPESRFDPGGPIRLEPGDLIVLFTDGVIEAAWPEGELVGEDQIRARIAALRDRPCSEIVEALLDPVVPSSGITQPLDDLTAVVLRYVGISPDD
jgi:PAS domain S-box-containing protein